MASNKLTSLSDLLTMELRDLYSAEKQIVKALPRMIKAAHSPKLQDALREHLEVTQQQVTRLEEACGMLEVKPGGHKCAAMEGLLKEGSELVGQRREATPAVFDAALIAAAQRVEHDEIAGYGAAAAFANHLGRRDIAELLGATLAEEKDADGTLNELAESEINVEAEVG